MHAVPALYMQGRMQRQCAWVDVACGPQLRAACVTPSVHMGAWMAANTCLGAQDRAGATACSRSPVAPVAALLRRCGEQQDPLPTGPAASAAASEVQRRGV